MDLKYQYVIIQGDNDYYEMMTENTKKRKEAIIINGLFDIKPGFFKKIVNKIYHCFEDKKKYGKTKILLPFMFRRKLKGDKPVCFIIWGWYANDVKSYLGQYLRKKYPGCKIVCRFEDIIEKMAYENIEDYRDAFDYLQSFDESDAKKHNVDYFPSWYDSIEVIDSDTIRCSDVFFVGRAKERFDILIQIYDYLESRGIECLFFLVDVPEEKRVHRKNIIYSGYIPYYNVLQMVKKTKCLLEIPQEFGTSETLRVYEAITYNKKLITNNMHIKNKDYYSEQAILCFRELDDIDISFINADFGNLYTEDQVKRLRPIKMLEYIDAVLQNQ